MINAIRSIYQIKNAYKYPSPLNGVDVVMAELKRGERTRKELLALVGSKFVLVNVIAHIHKNGWINKHTLAANNYRKGMSYSLKD